MRMWTRVSSYRISEGGGEICYFGITLANLGCQIRDFSKSTEVACALTMNAGIVTILPKSMSSCMSTEVVTCVYSECGARRAAKVSGSRLSEAGEEEYGVPKPLTMAMLLLSHFEATPPKLEILQAG